MTLNLWNSRLNHPLAFDMGWANIAFSLIGVLNADSGMICTVSRCFCVELQYAHFGVEGSYLLQSYGFHSRQKGPAKRKVRRRERKKQGEVVMWNIEKENSHVLGSQKLIFWDLKTPRYLAACLVRKTSQNEFDRGRHCLLRWLFDSFFLMFSLPFLTGKSCW